MSPDPAGNNYWSGRRCLITGAGGFIGTALTARLESARADVQALGHSAAAKAGGRACDVTDVGQVREAFRIAQPEVVFHLAGKVSNSRALDLVMPTLATNLLGTVHVLLAAAQRVPPARVVCLGSLHEPDQVLPPVPPTPYAAAKFAANAYARMFAEIFSVPATIARPLMVYGPGQLDFAKLVPYLLQRLLGGKPAEMSSGKQGFDWVYVDDVVEALLAVGERSDLAGRTIDVGTGVLTRVADIAVGIARRVGSATDALRMGVLPDRGLEPTRVADVEAAARATGWRARVTVEEGLDRTVEWYRRYFGH
jgi:UDP-glucose 4-epimerase